MEILAESAPPVSIPRIRTERLLLREFRATDFDAFAANLLDPLATAFLTPVPDRRSAYRVFLGGLGSWLLDGAGWWAVELESTSAFVGSVGAFYREGLPDLEVGWTVLRSHWRQGIASEAASAALAYGQTRLHAKRVIAHIDAGNTASIRVSQRLGMRFEGEVDFFGETTGRYAISSSA